ncbi:MAG: type I methionyl aminopeptidase [Nitrospirota bacterium]
MIILKSSQEIEKMALACRIVAEALEELKGLVKPGVTTLELDRFVETFILDRGGAPAFKGYRGYPNSLCTSINSQVVHGIPSPHSMLEEGDIISLDLGVYYDGYYGDGAVTYPVGNISTSARKLLDVTEDALYEGIGMARPGYRISDISSTIQTYVEKKGYSVVRDFVGHGIGRSLHEEPQIPNFGPSGQGPRIKEGMTFAIEPMVNAGDYAVVIMEDKWTAVTKDGSLSAHFEHTVAVTKDGTVIMTQLKKD